MAAYLRGSTSPIHPRSWPPCALTAPTAQATRRRALSAPAHQVPCVPTTFRRRQWFFITVYRFPVQAMRATMDRRRRLGCRVPWARLVVAARCSVSRAWSARTAPTLRRGRARLGQCQWSHQCLCRASTGRPLNAYNNNNPCITPPPSSPLELSLSLCVPVCLDGAAPLGNSATQRA